MRHRRVPRSARLSLKLKRMQPIVPLTATTTATATTAIAVVPAVPHAVSVGGGKPLPREPLHINQSIDLEEEIGPSDPRWVDFDASRGQRTVTLERMALKMGLSLRTGQLRARASLHALLFGPIGCGKSSELKRFAETLTQTGKPHSNQLLPVVLNVRGKMDLDNLRYVDVLMALANALVAQPEVAALKLPDSAIAPLHKWFFERVTEDAQLNELTGELRAEAQGGFSFLGLVRFLARFSAVAKHSSTSKDVVRKVTQNNFSEFAEAFNQLVLGAEAALQHAGIAQRLLFIVDGTDKITSDADAQRLFSTETEQLLLVTALVIYTAPIAFSGLRPWNAPWV